MNRRHLLWIALFSFGLYFNTLFNDFMWDDHVFLSGQTGSARTASELVSPGYWQRDPEANRLRLRPLRMASFVLDISLYGANPWGYHLTNSIVNAAASAAFYPFAIAAGLTPAGALAGGLLFAAHPAHVETVAWIKNRSDLLCGLFFFLSIALCASYLRSGRAAVAAASMLAMLLALFSKEMALVFPLVVAAYALLFRRDGPALKRAALLAGTGLLVSLAWVYGKEYLWQKDVTSPTSYVMDAYMQARIVIFTISEYLHILFLPFRLAAERPLAVGGSPLSLVNWALLAFLAAGAWLAVKRDKELGFAWLWTAILLVPVSNIVFLESRPIAEQRLYLPSAGLALAAGALIGRLAPGTQGYRAWRGVFAAVLLLFSGISFQRTFVWRNPVSFWTDAVKKSPGYFRANFALGDEYFKAGDFAAAVQLYETAAKDTDSKEIHLRLGFCYDQLGEYPLALANYARAQRLSPEPDPDIYNKAGIVHEKSGNRKEAQAMYRRAAALDPSYEPALMNLARMAEEGKAK